MPDNYAEAALRHYEDAEHLASLNRYDNAGHLIGFAGECAMKQKLRDLFNQKNRDFIGHHPNPQSEIRIKMQSRGLTGPWLALASGPKMFRGWIVDQRYASDDHVSAETYEIWKSSAKCLISMAKIRPKGNQQ